MLFKHPMACAFVGTSFSGKSYLIKQILENRDRLFDKKFEIIEYYYSAWSKDFESIKGVKFIKGLPSPREHSDKKCLLILEDQLNEKKALPVLINLLIRDVHHCNTSLLYTIQDFHFNRALRTITLNTRYFALYKNRRDHSALASLFRQLDYPTDFLKAAHKDATAKPFGYLVCNLSEEISEELRFCTDILAENPTFYINADENVKTPLQVTYYECSNAE